MQRVTAVWNGFVGAPGYSNFYFEGPLPDLGENTLTADQQVDKVHDFFAGLFSWLAPGTSIAVDPSVVEIDPVTGMITGEADGGASDTVQSFSSGSYSAPSGANVTWNTGAYVNGKRVKGRTFLVPLSGGSYQDNGTLATNCLADIRTAALGLLGSNAGPLSSGLCIWHRPRNRAGGSTHRVTSATVPDRAAILRSRRD